MLVFKPLSGTYWTYIVIVVLIVVVHVAVVEVHDPRVVCIPRATFAYSLYALAGHQEQILSVPLLVLLYRFKVE
jgi:hypothetical protein